MDAQAKISFRTKISLGIKSVGESLSSKLHTVLGERAAKLVEHPLFLTGIAFIMAIVPTRLLTADSRIVIMCWVFLVLAWIFFSAAIYRCGFYTGEKQKRAERATCVLILMVLLIGWYFLPAPKEQLLD